MCRQARASAAPSSGSAERCQRARIEIYRRVRNAAPRPIDYGSPHVWGKVATSAERGPALGRVAVVHGKVFRAKVARLGEGCRLCGAMGLLVAPNRGAEQRGGEGVHLPSRAVRRFSS